MIADLRSALGSIFLPGKGEVCAGLYIGGLKRAGFLTFLYFVVCGVTELFLLLPLCKRLIIYLIHSNFHDSVLSL